MTADSEQDAVFVGGGHPEEHQPGPEQAEREAAVDEAHAFGYREGHRAGLVAGSTEGEARIEALEGALRALAWDVEVAMAGVGMHSNPRLIVRALDKASPLIDAAIEDTRALLSEGDEVKS